VIFNGEKLYLKQIPTSSKSNEDARYKYDLDFVSDRVSLERVYLYDVVSPFVTERPITESSTFSFYGDINELAKRINASLIRSGLASLVRKYVAYPQYPSMNVPYLTYEQWNMVNADPSALYGTVFGSEDEILMFYSDIYTALGADYNLYLMSYIYENTNGVYDLTGFQCKIGNDKYGNPSTSEEKLITFENNTIHEALQQFHDTFELEYYITCEKDSNGNFTGNTWIMVADCEHDFADWAEDEQDFVRDDEGIPTTDNPFDWFEEPDEWDVWDRQHGYWTNNRLARLMATTDALGELDETREYEWACQRLAELRPFEYIVVTPEEMKEMLAYQKAKKAKGGKE
jgi:hypothetical protein